MTVKNKTILEIIDRINAAEISSPYEIEDILGAGTAKEITTVNLDERRWYVLGTTVFEVEDEFFGVRGGSLAQIGTDGLQGRLFPCRSI